MSTVGPASVSPSVKQAHPCRRRRRRRRCVGAVCRCGRGACAGMGRGGFVSLTSIGIIDSVRAMRAKSSRVAAEVCRPMQPAVPSFRTS